MSFQVGRRPELVCASFKRSAMRCRKRVIFTRSSRLALLRGPDSARVVDTGIGDWFGLGV